MRAMCNGQGSVALPAAYEHRIGTASARLLAEGRRLRVGPSAVEATEMGVFVHRMPVMSRWPGEAQARLHCWPLSADWPYLVAKLLQVTQTDHERVRYADRRLPMRNIQVLGRLLSALYQLLCLDATAYVASTLTSSNRRDTVRHPLPKHRLVTVVRRRPTVSLLVGLTRTP